MYSILLANAPVYKPSTGRAGTLNGVRYWNVDSNAPYNFQTMFNNLLSTLYGSILAITAAVFITGALMYIIGSFGNEVLKSNGKGMMIGSLIGMTIVLMAKFIVGLALYFMYAGSF
jgi:hypothetical protein